MGSRCGANDNEETIGQSERLCGSLAYLVRALAGTADQRPEALWLITRGAQAVGERHVASLQAPVWGIGATLGLEHPEFHTRCLDLDPAAGQGQVALLVQELLHPQAEDRIALRAGTRQVARLERMAEPDGGTSGSTGTPPILITGGFGGLGLRLAEWLGDAQVVERHIVFKRTNN